ncbi:hypothetical protein OSTOST_18832, partial [Ostertagia ostertagi]
MSSLADSPVQRRRRETEFPVGRVREFAHSLLEMWSAWLIVIYTITCLLVIGIIAIGVWFVRVDMQRSKMIS